MKVLVVLLIALILDVTYGSSESVIPSKTEYERYLDQILLVFDRDPRIKEILKNATPEDIKNGVIEKTLRRIHPDIRSKLDEVKRNIIMEYRAKLKRAKMDDKVPEDLYKFQDEDLKHLLQERHDRLKTMDDERKKQFKKYEMEKELKQRMAKRAMNEYERKVQEALDLEEKELKEKKAKNLKHPGNKAQLEEVWEREGFDKGTFNPKTFFKMHDLNADGEWDDFELEAVFEKEVEALFEGLEDDDEEERYEEVSRMREHVIEHVDKNGDGVVQLEEFLEYAKGKEFDHEDPWDTVFSSTFSEDELVDFEKRLDEDEKKELAAQAEIERVKRMETIKKFEDESKINMDMLKEHSEKLRLALMAANKAKNLEDAKKIVAEAAAQEEVAKSGEIADGQNQKVEDVQQQTGDDIKRQAEEKAEQEKQNQVQMEQARQAQILAEQQAEQRKQAEILAEQKRQAEIVAEKDRQTQIQQEQEKERQAQIQAEQQRQLQIQQEQQRQAEIIAEQQRQAQAEQQKILAEQQRIQAEQQKIQEEQQRIQAEQLKQQEEHKKELEAQLKAIDLQAQQQQ